MMAAAGRLPQPPVPGSASVFWQSLALATAVRPLAVLAGYATGHGRGSE